MTFVEPGVGWTPLTEATLPPESVLLDVITPGGDERQLIFEENLFWIPSQEIYVYFAPAFWRKAQS